MSRPLDPDSQSERIFSDDDGNEEDSFSLNPLSAQQAHRASSPSPNAMKRRRILPAIFDSSGEEENDEEHSQELQNTPTLESKRPRTRVSDETPVCQPNKSIRSILEKILQKQDEILKRLKALEKREQEGEEKPVEEKITVPPNIRNAIRDGYSDGQKRGYTWMFDNKKQHDDENTDMSNHISMFVKGLNSDVEERVIQCGIKRYFLSKRQESVLKSKNKHEEQKAKRVMYERKKEKAKRRTQALEELQRRGWQTEQRRTQIKKVLKVDFTSSDEECDDGFITHPPSWQSDIFAKVKSKLDRVFLEICSTKSRRLMQKRTIGSSHAKSVPNYPEECSWIVNKD